MIAGKDILCLSSLDWDTLWTSKHQIMHRLAQGNRVLYVDEPASMLAPLLVRARWKRWRAVYPRLHEAEKGLWVLTPPPVIPGGNKWPRVNRINQSIIARYVRWAMKRLAFSEEHIFWTYLPSTVDILDRLYPTGAGERSALVVYHCVDEHAAFPGYFISPELVRRYDEELTRRADLVITTSEQLRESRERYNPHTYTVLNAADVQLFNEALAPGGGLPDDLSAIPEPRLAIVGVHDHRLDVDAVEAIAQDPAGWQVVLIGPLGLGHAQVERLTRIASVHLLGSKPRQELPAYLRGVKAALIPYKANELTRSIFPLKLFEYLAAGLPVVAGGLPELRRYKETIYLAEKPEDYPDRVRAAISDDSPRKRAERVALAAENSWEHRVERISGLVAAASSRKAAQSVGNHRELSNSNL